jgi:DNA-binding NarL/FixJ family response regulator
VLTAVDPEFGIVDLDFETYLGKPVTGDEILEAVESVTERGDYQEPEWGVVVAARERAPEVTTAACASPTAASRYT